MDSLRVASMAQVIRQVVRILEDGGSGASRLGALMGSGVEFADEVSLLTLLLLKERERGKRKRQRQRKRQGEKREREKESKRKGKSKREREREGVMPIFISVC